MADPSVLYVGPFSFPWGEAASRRVMGVASSIAASGRHVTVIPGRGVVGTPDAPDGNPGVISAIGGIDEFAGGRVERAWNWIAGMGRDTRRAMNELPLPSHVIVYGGSLPYLRNLSGWCRRRGVPLLLDMVEWYDPKTFPGGAWGPVALGDRLARSRLHPKVDGVIAISSLLKDHYEALGLPVALVPPTVVRAPGEREAPPLAPVRVSYAGTPGKKDEIALMLRAFGRARAAGAAVEFVIAGPSVSEVCALLGAADLSEGVRVLGRLDQAEIPALLDSVHFSMLLREDKLSSNAGFPTKFVESVIAGVPVIGNLTSDLSSYLVDGSTGFVADLDEVDLSRALLRAAALGRAEYLNMMVNTTRMASEFNYLNYAAALDELLAVSAGPAT